MTDYQPARFALYSLLFIMILSGALSGYAESRNVPEPRVWVYALDILFSFISFVWYCRDGDARGFIRSRWMNVAIIGASVVAIPCYLWRSRAPGERGRSIRRYLGFLLLLLVVTGAGLFVGAMLA